jgi:hypothetical protein
MDNLAFISVGFRMVVLDVSDPSQPVLIGQTPPFPDAITDIRVIDNYAYATNRFAGFRIFDVSNPSSPVQVGYLEYPGFQLNTLDVVGTRAYLAAG